MEKVIKVICKVCGCTREDILNPIKGGKMAWHTHIYVIVRSMQGISHAEIAQNLGKQRVTIYNCFRRLNAIETDPHYGPMFQRILKKLKINNDQIKQFRRRYSFEDSDAKPKAIKAKPPQRWIFNKNCEYVKTMHSFDIKDEDIERACQQAERFFEKYGKGHRPINELINDKNKYIS